MRRIWMIVALAAAGVLVASAGGATKGTNLSFVAYSTPKTVMGKIIAAYQATPDGSGVSFSQSYAGSTDQARSYVQSLFKHVVSQDTTSRNATNTFLSGKGDVMLTYESEALASRQTGTDIQYVIPRQTVLIELPLVLDSKSQNKDKAIQF